VTGVSFVLVCSNQGAFLKEKPSNRAGKGKGREKIIKSVEREQRKGEKRKQMADLRGGRETL